MSSQANYMQVTDGVYFAHGPYTGQQCSKWPTCATDPQRQEFIAMGMRHLSTGELPAAGAASAEGKEQGNGC